MMAEMDSFEEVSPFKNLFGGFRSVEWEFIWYFIARILMELLDFGER